MIYPSKQESIDYTKLTIEEFRGLPDNKVQTIPSASFVQAPLLSGLNETDVKRLPDKIFAMADTATLGKMKDVVILESRHLAHLGSDIKNDALHPALFFDSHILQKLTPNQLGALSARFIGTLKPSSLSNISASQVSALKPESLTEVCANQMAVIPSTTTAALSKEQIAKIGSKYELTDQKHPRYGFYASQYRSLSAPARAACFATFYKSSVNEWGRTLFGWVVVGWVARVFVL
jgi:hypothetical protein